MLSKNENIKIFFLILIAFSFSVIMRLYWPIAHDHIEHYKYNNEYILTTNDAFFWAEGVRDLVKNPDIINENSPIYWPISILTATIYKISPFSLETVIAYTPIFFASLLVIPLILIGKQISNLSIGFISALLASIAHSYYNRTIVGYFDTDFLNIVFPMFLIWSLVSAIKTKENKYLVFTAIEIILYRLWYPQSYALESSFLVIIFFIAFYEYYKTKDYKYNLTLISFMFFSMMMLDSIYRIVIVTILFVLLFKYKEFFYKNLKYIFLSAILLFIVSGGLNPIIGKLELYLIRDIKISEEGLGLHFYAVSNTISELKPISFETMGIRSIGSFYIFLFSLLGYIYFLYKNRVFILTLPMVGLGFLSMFAGLRFTIYLGPIMALGFAYLIVYFSDFISDKFSGNIKSAIKTYLLVILLLFALIPNLNNIKSYDAFPTVDKQTVESLVKLNEITSKNDYTIGWWSYGYLIRYYSETNTLIDGGRHSGSDNFPISYILGTKSQKQASNMAKLLINYELLRKEQRLLDIELDKRSYIEQMTIQYGFEDTNKFLENLENININLPNEGIYLFLPAKTVTQFNSILKFSNIDLMTGKEKEDIIYYSSRRHIRDDKKIVLDSKVTIDLENNFVSLEEEKLHINKFITTRYDKNENLIIDSKEFDNEGQVNVIYLEKYNFYIVLDDNMLNSLLIQLFVFENYDKNLFEPIELTPMSKIYKIKK